MMDRDKKSDLLKKMINPSSRNHDDAHSDTGNSSGNSTTTGRDVDSQPAQLDQAVMDSLIKRAEAEAAQQYRDDEFDTMEAQVKDKKPAAKKRNAKSTPSQGKGNQKSQQQQLKQDSTNQIREGGGEEASEEIRKIVAEQAGLAMAQHLSEEEENLKKAYNSTSNNHLLQMATEVNETAKMEKLAKMSQETTNRESAPTRNTHQKGETIQQTTLRRTSQLSPRPGAYMGAPGEALLRANTLRFSLVGASGTTDLGGLVQVDDPVDSSFVAERDAILPSNNNSTIDNQHLAVANLVLDDSDEEQTRPLANPVDLEEKVKTRNRLRQFFVVFVLILVIVAAIVVGTVSGTQQKKEPGVVTLWSSETPTVVASMEPSEAPSSAPTGVLALLLDNLPSQTLASLNSGSETPQWKAWQWLVNHQNITFLTEWRKEQLFALATFYYSFEGEKWNPLIKGHGWMDDSVEECYWFSSGFGYFYEGKFNEEFWRSSCNNHGKFTSLWLDDLQLSGMTPSIPPEITMLTSLSHLELAFNDIETSISSLFPAELYEMTALTMLAFYGQNLTGPLPSELGQLTALEQLWFFRTQLTGQIPSELGRLTDLTGLAFFESQFTGQIPSHIGLLTQMLYLEWFDNQFSGQVPSELVRLTALEWLIFDSNELSGQVPSEFGQLTALDQLHLKGNQITGQIPSELGQLTAMKWLLLNENQMTGPVPSEFGILTNLEILNLTGNLGLSGTIPEELCFLQNVSCTAYEDDDQFTESCHVGFDCTSVLCGCDCACLNSSLMEGGI
ncbi:expressed unknown protein [Seminavis robusta]|uniref:L domain-like protein n=1 Tax=Seminavis robusta TaxID=568900 RepID=A0A9N8E189_9STRA|nr:expressed unknown protein [Seminavis robusta]|eukprot:Sro406_g136371.1  (784) ;mRNA; r:23642-25993